MGPEARRRPPVGGRGLTVLAVLVAGLVAASALGLFHEGPGAGEAGLRSAGRFLSRALSPTLRSEAPPPFGGESLVPALISAVHRTIVFGAAALGIALFFGFLLGFLASTAWWSGDPAGGRSAAIRLLRRTLLPVLYGVTRVFIAVLRSVHELIWAVLFLAAFGRSEIAVVVALALPYAGTVAKVFSEMIDEAPREAAGALRAAGAGPAQVFLFGLLPRALPDMTAYAFYQFECLLRSSAVLGFFGFGTLGALIAASFENLYYGEVWAWLYALAALLLLAECWSGALRRRFAT